ncbi:MAG: thioredoxin family protein [Acidiferrobacterales bacterium]|nr:thioredoxin family protein [Acidiferrobacterales bacterium]
MSRKKGKKSGKKIVSPEVEAAKAKRRQRSKIKRVGSSLLVTFVVVALAGFGLSAYKKSYAVSHDLSVIGNGTPVIIQIHDPKCPKCKKLMSNTKVALRDYGDAIEYKIADVTTSAGLRLQRQHRVQTISLLMFDGKGSLKRSTNGVKSVEELKLELADFARIALR